MTFFSLEQFPLENKIVFLRVDYNVPLKEKTVSDNTKIVASLPTIKYLLQKNCKIVLATHLGDPKGKVTSELSVTPLGAELKKQLPEEKITLMPDCFGKEIKEKIVNSKGKQIFLLENLRFHQEEEKNDPIFAHALTDLAEIYVNDAFAVCHRQHASVDAITHFLPAIAGFLVEKETASLSHALEPERPAVWILGGAKLEKIDLIKIALEKYDTLLIGGALACSFLRAKGIDVGMSRIDINSIAFARKILKQKGAEKIILPVDFVVAEKISPDAKPEVVAFNQIKSTQIALDIGPETITLFQRKLLLAKTIIWNGPLGYFELANFSHGTKEIAQFLGPLKATKLLLHFRFLADIE